MRDQGRILKNGRIFPATAAVFIVIRQYLFRVFVYQELTWHHLWPRAMWGWRHREQEVAAVISILITWQAVRQRLNLLRFTEGRLEGGWVGGGGGSKLLHTSMWYKLSICSDLFILWPQPPRSNLRFYFLPPFTHRWRPKHVQNQRKRRKENPMNVQQTLSSEQKNHKRSTLNRFA